jgi:DNA-binding NarL/FixJ family response regulator
MSLFRILIVDDFEPWADFVATLISEQLDLLVVGIVSDGLEAVREALALKPDLILLDLNLPFLNGIEVSKRLEKSFPRPQILFFSQHTSLHLVRQALASGSAGYVLKSDAAEIMDGIRAVRAGERFLSSTIRSLVSDEN